MPAPPSNSMGESAALNQGDVPVYTPGEFWEFFDNCVNRKNVSLKNIKCFEYNGPWRELLFLSSNMKISKIQNQMKQFLSKVTIKIISTFILFFMNRSNLREPKVSKIDQKFVIKR